MKKTVNTKPSSKPSNESGTPPAPLAPTPSSSGEPVVGADQPAPRVDPHDPIPPTLTDPAGRTQDQILRDGESTVPHAVPPRAAITEVPAAGEVPFGSSTPGVYAPSEEQRGPAVDRATRTTRARSTTTSSTSAAMPAGSSDAPAVLTNSDGSHP